MSWSQRPFFFRTDDCNSSTNDSTGQTRKAPPSKQEVIGAWGELHVLERLLKGAENASDALRRIAGWEAAGPARDIIDFRVLDVATGLAIEVKTGTEIDTTIGGVNQITVPKIMLKGTSPAFSPGKSVPLQEETASKWWMICYRT